MKTVDFTKNISEAANVIKNGGIVAVPTETVYGLACDGGNDAAVKKLFELKGRPESKPVSLMVTGPEAIDRLCADVPPAARALADFFWPGPLTIVLKAAGDISPAVTAGSGAVGLRCPDHSRTLELLRTAGCPLAVPSANLSGEEAPTELTGVLSAFDGKIDGYIDGGACAVGTASTVIDMSSVPYRILRQGGVSENDINMALMSSLTIIGITGGTGCGKTTALDVIEDMGGLTIDCDALYHELLLSSVPMREELARRFPGAIREGSGDTKDLGQIVFSDPVELAALNAITHRYVGNELMSRLTNFAKRGGRLAAIDAIALVESGVGSFCKATVGVISPREERVKRLIKREGIDRRYAELRIDAQKPNEFFQEHCDYTLMNDGTKEAFAEKSRELFTEIAEK